MVKEKTIHSLAIGILCLSVFLCYGEILSLFMDEMAEVTVVHTPFWVKGIKDIAFLFLSFLGLIFYTYNRKRVVFLICYFGCMGILFGFSFSGNKIFALSGIRWILAFTSCILIYPYINKDLLVKLSYCLIIIFCFHFIIQLVQIYYRMTVDVSEIKHKAMVIGFLDRAPGIFFMPNTSSFFSVLTWFLTSHFLSDKSIHKLKYFIPVSILLNKSGTGYVAFICIIIFEMVSKITWKMVGGMVAGCFAVLLGLQQFFHRPDIILISLGNRIQIFFDSLLKAELISTKFGYGSITAVLFARNFNISGPVPILDSTWSAIVVNCGLIPFFAIIIFFLAAVLSSYRNKRRDILIFLFILFCFGSTNSLFEAFPMNFLCSVTGIFYFKEIFANGNSIDDNLRDGESVQ